jgi:lipase
MLPVADALPSDLFVMNVDLRGRGDSSRLPGPSGMRAHAADLAAVLNHFGATESIIVGHSMGAYVATMLAKQSPSLVGRLVLVDGGFPIAIPDGLSPEEAQAVLLGPALTRFSMEISSIEGYLEFFRGHPSLTEWNAYMEAYVRYDLGPDLRPRGNIDLISTDGLEPLLDDEVRHTIAEIDVPTLVIRAGKGLLNQPGGLIPEELAVEAEAIHSHVQLMTFDHLNHYTIILSPEGAASVASAVQSELSDG